MKVAFQRAPLCLVAAFLGLCGCLHTETRLQSDDDGEREKELEVRTIGDITSVANANPIPVSGIGLVVGLKGTGSNPAPDGFRTVLEDFLRKRGVDKVKEILASSETSLVLVSGLIPAGARKDDPIDVEVTLPPHSKTASLKGGFLKECVLFNYDTTKHLNPKYGGANRLLPGHPLAKAWGPLLVGFGSGDEESRLKHGRIWGGGRCAIDRPVYLVLNNDQQRTPLAMKVAERVNESLHGAAGVNLDQLAEAKNNKLVVLKVAGQYKLNLPRYLRVIRLIPIHEGPHLTAYRRRLVQDLRDPERAVTAALRLEALGTDSIKVLKSGMEDEHALVKFCSAESLAYLGEPASGEVLAKMVKEQPALRAFSLTALASLDETVCHVRLRELLSAQSAETRYGAFRALRAMNDEHPCMRGKEYNESFFVHRVAPESPSLVHVSLSRRPEIVLFGADVQLKPPFSILAGEYTITASTHDTKCTLSRISTHHGIRRAQCGLGLEEVLHELGELGVSYPNVVEFLQKAGNCECLTASVRMDALPKATSVYELAVKGAENPDFVEGDAEILKADLGATPTLFEKTATRLLGTSLDADEKTLTREREDDDEGKSAKRKSLWD